MPRQTIVIYFESGVPCFCFKERHVERLRYALPDADIIWCRDRESYIQALPDADTVLSWIFRQEWFDIARKLRKIGTPAAGRDFFRITDPPAHIEIKNGTFHGPFMAETAVGLLLSVNRGILKAYQHQLRGELWPREYLFESRLIAGTHAVILGFGRIGCAIGRMLKCFGVRITGVKRNPEVEPPEWFGENDTVRPLSELHEVLTDADHVIVLLPSDTGTDDILGMPEFELMPSHAVIYNLGRGNCIDEGALAEALRSGRIAGACLDVFKNEPLNLSSPLADETLPGLLRMPHSSAYCERYMDRFLDEFSEWLK